jgi:hypothetical protein
VTGAVTPNVSAWRGQSMGSNIYVRFSIEINFIYATFDFGGTRILFV